MKLVDLQEGTNKDLNTSLRTEPLINEWIGDFQYIDNKDRKFRF